MSTLTSTSPDSLILIVDDQRAILDILSVSLESDGYDVLCTDDPRHALQLADDHPVALLLTDVVMPHMSGIELAKLLRMKHPQVKVLMMTGFVAEVPDYPLVRKPFHLTDLRNRVQTLLAEPSYHTQ